MQKATIRNTKKVLAFVEGEQWIWELEDKIIEPVESERWIWELENKIVGLIEGEQWIWDLENKIIEVCAEDIKLDTYPISDEFIHQPEVFVITPIDIRQQTISIPNLAWFTALRNANVYNAV